jgi:outer membrane protein insertion porin family
VTKAGQVCLAVVVVLTAGLLLASTARAQQSQPPPIVIRDIHVEGNRRVQDAVILGRVKSTVGSPFNPPVSAEDIRSIFGLGFFDDVQMRVEDFEGGVKVVFVVSERPFIRDVDFVGNKKQDRETLQEKIELKLGSVYNPVEVQRAVEKLRDFYEDEGYFEVQITPTVEKFADADVKVVFNIVEGRQITIDRSSSSATRGCGRPAQRTRWRPGAAVLHPARQGAAPDARDDIERIIRSTTTTASSRPASSRTTSPSIARRRGSPSRSWWSKAPVPGRRRQITGVTLLPEARSSASSSSGPATCSPVPGPRDSDAHPNLYSTIGRASADVNPARSAAGGQSDKPHLRDHRGPEVYVERINISGNVRSQDKILRRELPLHEGELYTLQKRSGRASGWSTWATSRPST